MKVVLVLAILVATVVAEDRWAYEPTTREFVHRFNHACYVMILNDAQHSSVVSGVGIFELQQLVRSLEANAAQTATMDTSSSSEFLMHHCKHMQTFAVVQAVQPATVMP